jgi:aspartyl/asparaginyl beta-hydroxylase (cupin superfamily)
VPTESVGALNRLYALVGAVTTPIDNALESLKRKNRALFRVAKYAAVIGTVYLLFVGW